MRRQSAFARDFRNLHGEDWETASEPAVEVEVDVQHVRVSTAGPRPHLRRETYLRVPPRPSIDMGPISRFFAIIATLGAMGGVGIAMIIVGVLGFVALGALLGAA